MHKLLYAVSLAILAAMSGSAIAQNKPPSALPEATVPLPAGSLIPISQWTGSAFVDRKLSGNYPLALGAAPNTRSIGTSGLLTGGGNLTADRTISIAPQAACTIVANATTGLAVPTAVGLGTGLSCSGGQIVVTASGTGDVVGPASAISGNIATFNGVSGKIIQDGALAANSLATLTGTQTLTGKTINGANNTLTVRLTNDVTNILPGANGGTGNGFTAFSGPATSLKTYTLPNASATILTTNVAVTPTQGGTGQTSYTDGELLIGNAATGGLSKATLTAGANTTITNGNGSITIASTGGGSISVTDGATTVNPTSTVSAGAGIKVSDGGGGTADISLETPQKTESTGWYTFLPGDGGYNILLTDAGSSGGTMPSAAATAPGWSVYLDCNAPDGCTIQRAGTDTLNGATVNIPWPYRSSLLVISDGVSNYSVRYAPGKDPLDGRNIGYQRTAVQVSWIAKEDPNNKVVYTATNNATVASVGITVAVSKATAGTIQLYKTGSGTACSGGTAVLTDTVDAAGTANTVQYKTVAGAGAGDLSSDQRLCLVSTGTGWDTEAASGGITVQLVQR